MFSGVARPQNYPANVYPFRPDSHFLYLTGMWLENAAVFSPPETAVHVEAQVRYEDGRTGTYSADLKIRDAKTFPPAPAAVLRAA